MPLIRRIPKFGFHSPFKKEFQSVNVSRLQQLFDSGKISNGLVNPEMLYSCGVVSKKNIPVKILGDGELKAKLFVTAHSFSKSAKEKISVTGGTVTELQPNK